jgi:DNA invertase Pin-like site-specific DNA recombinase
MQTRTPDNGGARAERAIIYIRKSQRDGGDSEHSPEVQLRAAIKHCQERGYLIDPHDVLDENVTPAGKIRNASGGAKLERRPKLTAAVAMIEARTHHVLVSERGDRLFRDLDVQREVIRRVESVGGRIEPVKSRALSHATADAELHSDIDGALAQWVKRTAMERSKDAVQLAINAGKCPSPPALGFTRGPTGSLVVTDQMPLALECFDMRYHGATCREVRRFLASRGVRRTVSGVRAMFRSKQYLGEIHFGDYTPNLNAHPAVIDRDRWDKVQAMVVPAGRLPRTQRLLARQKKLLCATCQHPMATSTNGSGYHFYRCNWDDCPQRVTVMAKPIEAAVKEAVILAARDKTGRAAIVAQAQDAAIEADRAQERLDNVIGLLSGLENEAAAQAKLADLRSDRDAKLARAKALADSVGPEVTVDVEWVFTHGSLSEQQSVIRNRVDRILVHPAGSEDRVIIHLFGQAPTRHTVKRSL